MMNRLGYGAWDELKAEIRNHWRFRFDWFIKSRTPQVGGCLAGRGGCAGVADEVRSCGMCCTDAGACLALPTSPTSIHLDLALPPAGAVAALRDADPPDREGERGRGGACGCHQRGQARPQAQARRRRRRRRQPGTLRCVVRLAPLPAPPLLLLVLQAAWLALTLRSLRLCPSPHPSHPTPPSPLPLTGVLCRQRDGAQAQGGRQLGRRRLAAGLGAEACQGDVALSTQRGRGCPPSGLVTTAITPVTTP